MNQHPEEFQPEELQHPEPTQWTTDPQEDRRVRQELWSAIEARYPGVAADIHATYDANRTAPNTMDWPLRLNRNRALADAVWHGAQQALRHADPRARAVTCQAVADFILLESERRINSFTRPGSDTDDLLSQDARHHAPNRVLIHPLDFQTSRKLADVRASIEFDLAHALRSPFGQSVQEAHLLDQRQEPRQEDQRPLDHTNGLLDYGLEETNLDHPPLSHPGESAGIPFINTLSQQDPTLLAELDSMLDHDRPAFTGSWLDDPEGQQALLLLLALQRTMEQDIPPQRIQRLARDLAHAMAHPVSHRVDVFAHPHQLPVDYTQEAVFTQLTAADYLATICTGIDLEQQVHQHAQALTEALLDNQPALLLEALEDLRQLENNLNQAIDSLTIPNARTTADTDFQKHRASIAKYLNQYLSINPSTDTPDPDIQRDFQAWASRHTGLDLPRLAHRLEYISTHLHALPDSQDPSETLAVNRINTLSNLVRGHAS